MNNKIRLAISMDGNEIWNEEELNQYFNDAALYDACHVVSLAESEEEDYDAVLNLAKESNADNAYSLLYIGNGVKISTLKVANTKPTADDIIALATTMHKTLRRDFLITNPRIAVLSNDAEPENAEESIVKPALENLFQSKIQCFGPYQPATFFEEKQYDCFDALLVINGNEAMNFVNDNDIKPIAWAMDTPKIIVSAPEADATNLAEIVFTIAKSFNKRKSYDEAYSNPLPKLYHEQKEGEDRRPRFAPLEFMKKKDEQ